MCWVYLTDDGKVRLTARSDGSERHPAIFPIFSGGGSSISSGGGAVVVVGSGRG